MEKPVRDGNSAATIAMRDEAQTEPRGILSLQVAFALTGVGTTLLGSLLPTLSVDWRLDDRRAGFLFAAQFGGSALGALLVGSHFFKSALRGYLLLVLSALAIGFFRGEAQMLLFFFTFGLGLGLAMTSTSMWMGKIFRTRRGAVLSVLNAWWCFGAVISAPLASIWVRRFSPQLFYPVLGTAVAASILPSACRNRADVRLPRDVNSNQEIDWKRVAIFALIAFLYVGSETSVGGWLMSYVHRLNASSNFLAPLATSCFWLALLCGRTISPWLLRRMDELQLLAVAIAGAFVSVVTLLLLQAPLATVISATCAGLMLGPIFPLCMATILALMHDLPKSKWTFSLSGVGAAALPALTGDVSTRAGSLHSGLLVPAFALSLMCAMTIFDRVARSKLATLSARTR